MFPAIAQCLGKDLFFWHMNVWCMHFLKMKPYVGEKLLKHFIGELTFLRDRFFEFFKSS